MKRERRISIENEDREGVSAMPPMVGSQRRTVNQLGPGLSGEVAASATLYSMSACPFCQEQMNTLFRDGLLRDECTECGAVWVEGEFLVKVMGESASAELLRRAKNQPGVCKGCEAQL